MEISTGFGTAMADVDDVTGPSFLLVLTHGAGGGVRSADLLAARRAGLEAGAVVALVTQPYRVAGARAPGSGPRQDAAWLEVISALRKVHPVTGHGWGSCAPRACRS